MIGLATPTYDPAGHGMYRDDPSTQDSARSYQRRATRTATLDGGSVVADTGFSDADRTVTISLPDAPPEAIELMSRLVRYYSTITVSLRDGCFSAVPSRTWTDRGAAKIEILITEKISG